MAHIDHDLLLARHATTERGSRPPRTAQPRTAREGQLSTGVRGSVLNRRRYEQAGFEVRDQLLWLYRSGRCAWPQITHQLRLDPGPDLAALQFRDDEPPGVAAAVEVADRLDVARLKEELGTQ